MLRKLWRHSRIRAWELLPLPGETDNQLKSRRDEQYFNEQLVENDEWWRRIGKKIDLQNALVLDFACGHGALTFSMAASGATEVIGIDLDTDRIAFASAVLLGRYRAFSGHVTFAAKDLCSLKCDGYFDFIVTKDAFEHVADLKHIGDTMRRLLKPGGKLIVGLSPLYYSPFGDHGRLCLPRGAWLHSVLPEWLVLKWVSMRRATKIKEMAELGLNKLTPAEFRNIFSAPLWRVRSLKYNRGSRLLMPLMSVLRKIPFLEKWFTVNIYAVLEST